MCVVKKLLGDVDTLRSAGVDQDEVAVNQKCLGGRLLCWFYIEKKFRKDG